MFLRHRSSATAILVIGLAALTMSAVAAPASAQGLFDSLFGRRQAPASANAYADPNPQMPQQLNPVPERPRTAGGSVAYCVRMCDGRYFPIQRHSNANPTEVCNSFCPASTTKIFNGSAIDHAVAKDGTRYSSIPSAFVYRDKIVDGCTCNGKDSVGLVTTSANDDPTLRPGDLVATSNGMMAYRAGKKRSAEFTPIESYSGMSADMRRKLSDTKIVPGASPPAVAPAASTDDGAAPARRTKGKRVQLER